MPKSTKEILRLLVPRDPGKRLDPAKAKGLLPGSLSSGYEDQSGGGGGGISGPLTEPDASTRTFHPTGTATTYESTDGLLTIEMAPIDTVEMEDGDSNAFDLVFDDPNP